MDIDDILHDIDYEEEVNRRIQEQKDAVSFINTYSYNIEYIVIFIIISFCFLIVFYYYVNFASVVQAFDGCNL